MSFGVRFFQGELHGKQLAVVNQAAKRISYGHTCAEQSSVDRRLVQFGEGGKIKLYDTVKFNTIFGERRGHHTVVLGRERPKLCVGPYAA